jgi:hypothetical protein
MFLRIISAGRAAVSALANTLEQVNWFARLDPVAVEDERQKAVFPDWPAVTMIPICDLDPNC